MRLGVFPSSPSALCATPIELRGMIDAGHLGELAGGANKSLGGVVWNNSERKDLGGLESGFRCLSILTMLKNVNMWGCVRHVYIHAVTHS